MMKPKGAVSHLALGLVLTSMPGVGLTQDVRPRPYGPQQGQAASQAGINPETGRRNINPYNRDINLTVPLQFNRRVLGEMPVLLTRDDRFIVNSAGFIALISPLLTEAAQEKIKQELAGLDSFEPMHISGSGIQLEYDPDQLAVMVLRIDPTHRVPESLFRAGAADPPEQGPEDFSAYLNTSLSLMRRNSTGEVDKPGVFLNGAVNYRGLVFEADVQGRHDRFSDTYEVDRRYARFVYDQPEAYRRWFLGDLNPEMRGRQGYVEMGGIGVARQKRRFEAFRNNVLSSARQMVLQESSVVRVTRNGVLLREFRLDPGQYDLSSLPLTTGNNDIQLEVEGQSGFRENINYNAYLDTIELEPGDYEYGAYVGVVGSGGLGSPNYDDGELAFTGYYRKAFLDRPAIGIGLQASQEVQTLTGQTQYVLGPGGRLRLDGALSRSDEAGEGFAATVGYDYILDFGGTADIWSVVADYTSENFTELGRVSGNNPVSWAVSTSYSKRFTPDLTVSLSGSYRVSRSEFQDDFYNVNLISNYRFSRDWLVQVGVEYMDLGSVSNSPFGGIGGDGFGATVALVWSPRYDRRVEARYASARESGSLRFQQSPRNQVDSYGYSVSLTDDPSAKTASGQLDYIANRFDASLSHFAYGPSYSDITQEQATSVRVGTSFALANGKLAMGRQIFDSFAIIHPHPTLKGGVIAGESLEGGRYTSRSGPLGPALDGTLTSYVNQSVRYDAISAPRGYDIGAGILRVRPGYRSGYTIEVGSNRFVSALGRLTGHGDKPLNLMSGRVVAADDPTAEPELFFTNSVGRFAMQSLEPGKRYRVELSSSPAVQFEFTVPQDNEGLLDLGVINLPLDAAD